MLEIVRLFVRITIQKSRGRENDSLPPSQLNVSSVSMEASDSVASQSHLVFDLRCQSLSQRHVTGAIREYKYVASGFEGLQPCSKTSQ